MLLGASTLMLAVGAAAIGWTTQGDEVAAGITAAAFLVCAVLLHNEARAKFEAQRTVRGTDPVNG